MSDYLPGGIRIVHEDHDVLVVDKPTGMLSSSQPGDDLESVFRAVKVHVRNRVKRRGTQVWIIHRLDKEASGLLVFAKTEKGFTSLKEQFRSKRVHRLYTAVVEGEIKAALSADPKVAAQLPSGTIQSFLIESEDGLVRSVNRPGAQRDSGEPEAKLAVTHYRVLANGNDRGLIQLRLETGRKNQIRVHMREFGHPIVGDRRYGAKTDPIERICLHATELGFSHPSTGQHVRFHSTPPPQFTKLVGKRGMSIPAAAMDSPFPAPPLDSTAATPRKPESQPPAARDAVLSKPAARSKAAPSAAKSGPTAPDAPANAHPDGASWDHVADWYSSLLDERGSDHHERVIVPGTIRLLDPGRGRRILDVACGQGLMARRLAALGAEVVGVDSSPKLIAAATSAGTPRGSPAIRYETADARRLQSLDIGTFDDACCIMALMNIEPVSSVLRGVAARLTTGGRFLAVMLHPAFRSPGQTSWGWAETDAPPLKRGPKDPRPPVRLRSQFRRVDGYLSPGQREIVMNPGAAAAGKRPVTTITYHRPLQHYVRSFTEAGLLIDTVEEWPSQRQSEPGPHAAEENRVRKEIPMFLAIRGVRAQGERRTRDA